MKSFLDGKVQLHCGNMLDVLPILAENSIDSCVCDPPYHLTSIVKRFGAENAAAAQFGSDGRYARASAGFMGKVWDGGDVAFRVETWAQVLRVLKPGAHLIAFGGTRTYHRMVCAIEDAGFEIRDTIMWVYGQGFPKSHSVRKGAGDAICACETVSECDLRSMRDADVSAAIDASDQRSEVLFAGVSQQSPSSAMSWSESTEGGCRPAQFSMEGRGDLSEAARELRQRPICEMPTGFDFDGESRRIRDGAPSSDGANSQAAIATNGMRPPSRPSTVEQHAEQSGNVAVQSQPQERGAWPLCRRCGKPIVPDGLGTALKPACEPIILALKPLSEGTVAANVLRWGTGALNIDGCRVAGEARAFGNGTARSGGIMGESEPRGPWESPSAKRRNGKSPDREIGTWANDRRSAETFAAERPGEKLGRWPANVIHDGSDEVLAEFPNAPGQQFATGPQYDRNAQVYGKFAGVAPSEPRGDSGSAARFFYTAKADSDDRLGSKHPTVKPLDLIQYLVRLVTPPKGTVLDCFAGTGTTGEAAWREGMIAVLIEREAEYQADIIRRMGLVLGGPEERARAAIKERMKDKPQDAGPLFATRTPEQQLAWDEMWSKPFDYPERL